MNLWRHDRRLARDCPGLVGVDEAGRGALAGPVAAAAVWIETGVFADRRRARAGRPVNDSKQLTAAQREDCLALLETWGREGALRAVVAFASVGEIAELNILGATRLAMDRCLRALQATLGTLPAAEADTPLFSSGAPLPRPRILIDGRPLRPFSWRHDGLVDGDARSFVIAAASIFAKVARDRLMRDLDGAHPGYGLARHKGYGTKAHWDALRRLGPTPSHRALFLRKGAIVAAPAEQTDFAL